MYLSTVRPSLRALVKKGAHWALARSAAVSWLVPWWKGCAGRTSMKGGRVQTPAGPAADSLPARLNASIGLCVYFNAGRQPTGCGFSQLSGRLKWALLIYMIFFFQNSLNVRNIFHSLLPMNYLKLIEYDFFNISKLIFPNLIPAHLQYFFLDDSKTYRFKHRFFLKISLNFFPTYHHKDRHSYNSFF